MRLLRESVSATGTINNKRLEKLYTLRAGFLFRSTIHQSIIKPGFP
jgi:hypothetical protein